MATRGEMAFIMMDEAKKIGLISEEVFLLLLLLYF